MDDSLLSHLPESMQQLIAVFGEAVALQLCERIGGISLVVPHGANPDSWLWERLGKDLTNSLVAKMAGGQLTIPKYDAIDRLLRRKRLYQMLELQMPVAQIALALGRTDRWVYLEMGKSHDPKIRNFEVLQCPLF